MPALCARRNGNPAGSESFSAISGAEDGALLLICYPGDILRSTDTGNAWQVVYHGGARLTAFRVQGNALIAYGDSSDAVVVSRDSGRSWSKDEGGRTKDEGNPLSYIPHPPSFIPLPAGTNSISFVDSAWYAVGEPGLICRRDGMQWREMHRAPFRSMLGTPPPTRIVGDASPLLLRFASQAGESRIEFSSAAHGAIAVGNRIYFTNDSAVTWSECLVPDTAPVSSFYLLSDTSALIGMHDGRLYYNSTNTMLRCDSILNTGNSTAHPILRIGWKDKLDGELFVLTDSLMYSVRSDLSSATPYPLPHDPGEHAIAASFPDAYTGFLLTDSLRRFDTLTAEGRDTTLLFDTCKVYRSLDGGATWNLVLKNISCLTNMYFENTKTGFLCGANGLILHTEDTGSRWGRAWNTTHQDLHEINMVNETTGYAVGDSGVVLLTQTSGRFWRPAPPEPLFMHPRTAYTGVGFSDEHTVYVVASDRCYKGAIPRPLTIHQHWHFPERHTLSISEHPNPSSGRVEFDIRSTSKDGGEPTVKICDVSGTMLSEVSDLGSVMLGEWSATADLSSLPVGVYTGIVAHGGEQAMCKFLIER